MIYKLEHNIEKGDIYISWEYNSTIENIINGKGTKLENIYYEGKNETDFLNNNIISSKAKTFFSKLNIDYISLLEYTFYDLHSEEELGIEKTIKAYIIDTENEIDCINYDKSDLFILSDGKIRGIDKLVLNDNYPQKKPAIFKLKGLINFLCVNEEMKKEIEKSKLKGVRFIEIESYTF